MTTQANRRGLLLTCAGHLCALAVGGVFLYAAWFKIVVSPNDFVTGVNAYQIIPRTYANLFALILPYVEVFAAAALVVPATRRAGGVLIAGMLVMFIVAVAIAMSKGIDIECGCYGKGSGKAGWRTIGQDILLLAATGLAMFLRPRRADPANAFAVQPV